MAMYNNQNYYVNPNNGYALNQTNVPSYNPSNPTQPSLVLVNGEDNARNYPVAAGNTVLLMDFNSNQFWLKSTEANGMSQHFRIFRFEEQTPKVEVPISQTALVTTEFATKKEIDDLRLYLDDRFKEMKNQMYKIRKPREDDK